MPKITPEKGKISLCGTQGCCPTVDFSDPSKVVLKDDLGGHVELTRKQWQDLKTKFTIFPKSRRS